MTPWSVKPPQVFELPEYPHSLRCTYSSRLKKSIQMLSLWTLEGLREHGFTQPVFATR